MLGVLDLDEVTVDYIKVPKSEIIGIDLEEPLEDIINQLRNAQHTRLPVSERTLITSLVCCTFEMPFVF